MRFFNCLILILLAGIFNNSIASNKLDSLKREVLRSPEDTNKVLQLKDLSYKYLKVQSDTAFFICKKAIKLSEKLQYDFGYATSLNQMGLVFKYKAQYDSALYYYNKSLVLFENLNNEFEKASILNRLGNVYKRYGKFDLSTDCFMKSLKIYQSLNDSTRISNILNNLGVLYYDRGIYDKSLEYYLSTLEIKKKLHQESYLAVTYMNIGNVYNELGSYDKSVEYYKMALDLMANAGNKYDRMLLLHNIGNSYEKMGKLKDAINFYFKAITIQKEIGEKEMLVFSLQGLGNTLIKEGSFKEGEKYLLKSYDLANEIQDIRKSHRLAINLYEVYLSKGDYKKSVKYLKDYVDIEDRMFDLEQKTQIIELEEKYNAEKREQQIAFLEKEKVIQQLELSNKEIESKQKSFQRNALILIIIIVVGLLLYYFIDNKKRKKLNQLLLKQNTKITDQRIEIAKQNDYLLESNKTKDKLFQIIAHDLRSPLVSMESITQLIPYWVEEQDFESLSKLSKTLELSVNNVLSLIDNLLNWALNQQGKFPYKPENIDLKKNLEETIDVYKPIAQIKNIELKFKPLNNVKVFADKNMIFTVMRNLLNNAVKFTPENGEITVGIERNQQFAKVWVKDSGIGMPVGKREEVFELANGQTKGTRGETGKGLGLFFCKEFVSMNNGDIYIESQKGKGTTITFTLPLFNIPEN
jgi:signal transduction histidine kinase